MTVGRGRKRGAGSSWVRSPFHANRRNAENGWVTTSPGRGSSARMVADALPVRGVVDRVQLPPGGAREVGHGGDRQHDRDGDQGLAPDSLDGQRDPDREGQCPPGDPLLGVAEQPAAGDVLHGPAEDGRAAGQGRQRGDQHAGRAEDGEPARTAWRCVSPKSATATVTRISTGTSGLARLPGVTSAFQMPPRPSRLTTGPPQLSARAANAVTPSAVDSPPPGCSTAGTHHGALSTTAIGTV